MLESRALSFNQQPIPATSDILPSRLAIMFPVSITNRAMVLRMVKVYETDGQWDKADTLLNRMLEIMDLKSDAYTFSTARTLAELAIVRCRRGKSSEAKSLYLRALAIWNQSPDRGRDDWAALGEWLCSIEQLILRGCLRSA
jgi:hypothetical protein